MSPPLRVRTLAGVPAVLLLATLLTPRVAAQSDSSAPRTREALDRPAHAVVLMYHRFGEDRYPSTSIRIDQFEAQLDHLEQGGFEILPLEEVVAAIRQGRPLPDLTVCITVDDAYRSVHEVAFPRLKARGWPFTVFVNSDSIDRKLPAYMTWDQMRAMREQGVTFANHTASHDSMVEHREGEDDESRQTRMRADIDRGRQRLREELGETPALFAYPYGDFDTASATLVAKMGYVAFGQHSGALGPGSDLRALPRFPMAEQFAGIDAFRDKVRALPMPLRSAEPWSPVTTTRRPELTVTLAGELPNSEQLTCFASGQGRIAVRWSEKGRSFKTQTEKPLSPGRTRYNCTAPSGISGRYYWYSHPWITDDESP